MNAQYSVFKRKSGAICVNPTAAKPEQLSPHDVTDLLFLMRGKFINEILTAFCRWLSEPPANKGDHELSGRLLGGGHPSRHACPAVPLMAAALLITATIWWLIASAGGTEEYAARNLAVTAQALAAAIDAPLARFAQLTGAFAPPISCQPTGWQ